MINGRFTFNPIENVKMSIDMLSGLLRLANKYDIPSIRTHMLLRLRGDYPTSFEDADFDSFQYIETDQDDAYLHVGVLNLAHQERIFSVLPLTLYFVLCDFTLVSTIFCSLYFLRCAN